jgi:hypothetical protein
VRISEVRTKVSAVKSTIADLLGIPCRLYRGLVLVTHNSGPELHSGSHEVAEADNVDAYAQRCQ